MRTEMGWVEMDAAKLEAFREGWRRREIQESVAEEQRWQKAMDAAKRIAARLREQWGATEVYLFGSAARRSAGHGFFRSDSDIDIAVKGIDPASYYKVIGDVTSSPSFLVDLVLMEDCSDGLLASVQRDGIPL